MGVFTCIVHYIVFRKNAALTCRFPGTEKAYHALTECVDARLLMKAAIYTATHYEVCTTLWIMSGAKSSSTYGSQRHVHPVWARVMQAANNSYNMSNGQRHI